MPEEGAGGAPGCDHRHRPHRLSEPGQQRPVLSVHLPRRARLRRDDDHRRDGDRRGARDRRAGAGRAVPRSSPRAYGGEPLPLRPEYLIPKPFDPRLMMRIAPAVAKAAIDIGRRDCARSTTWTPTAKSCRASSIRSGTIDEADLRPRRKTAPKRVVYAEGEEERVLRAVQIVVDEQTRPADPDRPARASIEQRIENSACACSRARLRPRQHRDDHATATSGRRYLRRCRRARA